MSLQTKLGQRSNPSPFGSSTPRLAVDSSVSRSPESWQPRPPSPLPAGPRPGAVESTRAILSSTQELAPSSTAPVLVSGRTRSGGYAEGSTASRTAVENPFFGNGGSRERMKSSAVSAVSGSGRVIAGLQSDLIQTKGALESARAQLKVTQRALEHLSRQNDDLKESKERMLVENEGLNKMLARKDRLQEESVARTLRTETSLAALHQSHRLVLSAHAAQLAEHEQASLQAVESKERTEMEYSSLRRGMQTMADGFKADLDWVKGDMRRLEATHQRDLVDARLKHSSLVKVYKAREESRANLAAVLGSVHTSLKDVDLAVSRSDEGLVTVQQASLELARLRRAIQDHERASLRNLSPDTT